MAEIYDEIFNKADGISLIKEDDKTERSGGGILFC